MKHQTSTSQNSTNPLLWVVAPALLFQAWMNARGLHCMSEGFVKLRQGQCSPVGFGAITHNGRWFMSVQPLDKTNEPHGLAQLGGVSGEKH